MRVVSYAMPLFSAEHTFVTAASWARLREVLTDCGRLPDFVPAVVSATFEDAAIEAPTTELPARWRLVLQALLRLSVVVTVEAPDAKTLLFLHAASELLTEGAVRMVATETDTETTVSVRVDVGLLGQIPAVVWERFSTHALPATLGLIAERALEGPALRRV